MKGFIMFVVYARLPLNQTSRAPLLAQEGMLRQRRSWGGQARTIECERPPRRFAPPLLFQEGSSCSRMFPTDRTSITRRNARVRAMERPRLPPESHSADRSNALHADAANSQYV